MSILKDVVKFQNNGNGNFFLQPSYDPISIHPKFESQYKLLQKFKNLISDFELSKWDYYKKLSNKYELVYISNDSYNSISLYKPISRAYYKLWEIIQDFNIIDNSISEYIYVGLAEAPGGFMEAFINYRKNYFLGRKDKKYCITLKQNNNDIPNWSKANSFIKKYNVNISYGADNTGNLYKSQNIKYLINQVGKNSSQLVTGDGGFDFSYNFDNQEIDSLRLIFCEIVAALGLNKVGGNFVLKIYDIFLNLTVDLIYLLSKYYDNIYFTKPHTSRPANSEKYLVCKGFRGIDTNTMNNLFYIMDNWETHPIYNRLFNEKLPDNFLYSIYNINKIVIRTQVENILRTILLLSNKLNSHDIKNIKNVQIVYAVEWCKKYNIEIDNSSKYTKRKYNNYRKY